MRALLVLALIGLLAAPLAAAADTLIDRWVEVNVGRPYRQLVLADMPTPGHAFLDLWCFENAAAQATFLGVATPETTACLPHESVTRAFPVDAGPVTVLVTGQGTGILDGPGFFRVLVQTQGP